MVQLMSRCDTFAEGAVTVSSTLLLAAVWNDKSKSNPGVHVDEHVLIAILVAASATLVTGVCPSLACCFTLRFPTACARWPSVTRVLAATVSSACLLALACLISLAFVSKKIVLPLGALFAVGFLVRFFHLCCQPTRNAASLLEEEAHKDLETATSLETKAEELLETATSLEKNAQGLRKTAAAAEELRKTATSMEKEAKQSRITASSKEKEAKQSRITASSKEKEAKQIRTSVDKSYEFLCGVTGVLFIGLEGMALEGMALKGTASASLQSLVTAYGDDVKLHMGIGFFICATGVMLMFVQMVPIHADAEMKKLANGADLVMTAGTVALLTTIMKTLMGDKGFLIFISPCIILIQLVAPEVWKLLLFLYCFCIGRSDCTTGAADNQDQDEEEDKPAPLGLTKVTFTGFFIVWIKTISRHLIKKTSSGGSPEPPSECSQWFLLCTASAIASGVSWRLLTHNTHDKSIFGKKAAGEAANVASFLTRVYIAVAAVLFAVMAWEAVTAKATA